ncbi:MAG: glycerophosphodiester phosphodiesterase [Actinomycetota bacterium]|nr:glycerophosphodiester phosphodiesterase [Actinomycetota bacterium]
MTNPWLERREMYYAHRGGALEAPSSTLFAMDRAVELGLPGLELDLHCTKDGVIVVLHDNEVDRTTSGDGRASDLNFEEIVGLDNAYWFVPGANEYASVGRHGSEYAYRGKWPKDPRFGVATFREVLARYPNTIVNVDIKAAPANAEPYESRVVEEILDARAQERVIVASFRDSSLFAVRKLSAEIFTSAGPGEISEFYFALISDFKQAVAIAKASPYIAFQIPHFYGEIELATKEFVDAAHEGGKAVHVWTINEKEEMELLIDRGVDGLITDRPSLLREHF